MATIVCLVEVTRLLSYGILIDSCLLRVMEDMAWKCWMLMRKCKTNLQARLLVRRKFFTDRIINGILYPLM